MLPVEDSRLWGLSVRTKDRGLVEFVPPDEADGGSGVREPRRPKPSPSSLAALAERFPGTP